MGAHRRREISPKSWFLTPPAPTDVPQETEHQRNTTGPAHRRFRGPGGWESDAAASRVLRGWNGVPWKSRRGVSTLGILSSRSIYVGGDVRDKSPGTPAVLTEDHHDDPWKPRPLLVQLRPLLVQPRLLSVQLRLLLVKLRSLFVQPRPLLVKPHPLLVQPHPLLVKLRPLLVQPRPLLVLKFLF